VHLLNEVAMLHHAREFDQSPQRDFTPLAAHLRPAQCLNQILRFLGQRLLADLHGLKLVPDAAVCLAARFLEIGNLFV
jgi:hypothetical protein